MSVGEQIKRMRTAKGLSQKEVITAGKLDKAQFSRIENSKTDPSMSTIIRITEALGVSLSELFATSEELKEVNSLDKTIMEKVSLIEQLNEAERQTLYTMLDAFVGKKKLKDTLSTVLNDLK